jgi:Co/Zn/Cd efflux system component
MLGDAAVSFGVVLAAVLTLWTGWIWLDPAISLAIAIFVLWVGWGLARSSVNLALDAVAQLCRSNTALTPAGLRRITWFDHLG